MRKVSLGQKKLLAEFSANVGVTWFAAGVIGAFVNEKIDSFGIMRSISWGISLAAIFVLIGFRILKGVTR